ncbi:MAG TPA: hypothetical protein VGE08_25030 [Steroidobacter sp.]|uniref:c-type cytochrome n=1 Tax=Steroidobacter sp. TaxID=1978227 RepID=UPI002ED8FC2E
MLNTIRSTGQALAAVLCLAAAGTTPAAADSASTCDVNAGLRVWRQCASCHTNKPDVQDKSGPNLHGVVGRKAGTVAYKKGFSAAMRAANLVWTPATLDRFLADPAKTVPGTYMVFVGVPDAAERAALICYLSNGVTR